MHRVYYMKMLSEPSWISKDLVRLLFPNLEEMIMLHGTCLCTHARAVYDVISTRPTSPWCCLAALIRSTLTFHIHVHVHVGYMYMYV